MQLLPVVHQVHTIVVRPRFLRDDRGDQMVGLFQDHPVAWPVKFSSNETWIRIQSTEPN